VQLWQDVYHWSPIKSAIHFLPIGLIAGPITLFAEPVVGRFEQKWVLLAALVLLIISSGTFPFANENTQRSYLAYDLPASIIGASGGALLFVTTSVAIFKNTPDAISGTIASILNSSLQLGAAVGSAVVTSLMSGVSKQKPQEVYAGRAAAFWFLFATMILEFAAVVVFYRTDAQVARAKEQEEDAEKATSAVSGHEQSPASVEVREKTSVDESITGGTDLCVSGYATAVATAAPTPKGPLSASPSLSSVKDVSVPSGNI